MASVDILISTTGNANAADLNSPGNGGVSAVNNESIITNGTGNSRNVVARSVFVNQLVNSGINALRSTFNFAKSNYGNFTGDYIGQQKIDNVFSVANIILSFGGSVVSGAVTGSVGGVPGAVVGAVAGAVVGAVDIGVNAAQNNINYNKSILKVNFSANFNAQRIGTILNSGNR